MLTKTVEEINSVHLRNMLLRSFFSVITVFLGNCDGGLKVVL